MNGWTKAGLVALRVVIGWHFLYEGVYKIGSDSGATSYLPSHLALQAATGRLRDYFVSSAPETLNGQTALARVDAWHDEIVRAFAAQKALGEDQKARLGLLRDEVKLSAMDAVRGVIAPSEVVNFDWTYVHAETLRVAPATEAERFTALAYLQSAVGPARGVFRALAPDIDGFERLTVAGAQALLNNRYAEIVSHFERAGRPLTREQKTRLVKVRDDLKASVAETVSSEAFQARLADYQRLRARVTEDSGRVNASFTRERLDADWKALDTLAGEMLGLVHEPLTELAAQTQAVMTVEQFRAGPLPRPEDSRLRVDGLVQWSLTLIGLCLLLGLFTPVAAAAAAGQLAMFYMASPPWPGYPAASLGGHYLYVDRNLIEMVASLVIATSGTGRWAGLDAYWPLLQKRTVSKPEEMETELVGANKGARS